MSRHETLTGSLDPWRQVNIQIFLRRYQRLSTTHNRLRKEEIIKYPIYDFTIPLDILTASATWFLTQNNWKLDLLASETFHTN